MRDLPANLKSILAELLLAVADDKLMLGHRNSDWTGLAPILEEDIAFSSIAQDEIAHAQALYEIAGKLLGKSGDELAFGRPHERYRCAHIVEMPDEFDWATALVRQFFCDHFDHLRLTRLSGSSYKPLADLAKRLAAEEKVHVTHVDGWITRLGRGTPESRQRIQAALDALTPLAPMLFEPVAGQGELESTGIYPPGDADMLIRWRDALTRIATDAGLQLELGEPDADTNGGRAGTHTPHLTELLDEMCEVYRLEPGAAW